MRRPNLARLGAVMMALVLCVLVGLHAPGAAAWWQHWRGGGKACPYGGANGLFARPSHAPRAGAGRAPPTTLLGLTLNVARRQDVAQWIDDHRAHCYAVQSLAADLECHLPDAVGGDAAEPGPSTVFFAFDRDGVLQGVHTMTDYADAAAAAQALRQLCETTNRRLGQQPTHQGTLSAEYLTAHVLRQVAAEYRLANVDARLSATHMPVAYIVEQNFRAIAN